MVHVANYTNAQRRGTGSHAISCWQLVFVVQQNSRHVWHVPVAIRVSRRSYNAFPEPSLRDLRHYSCAVTALTEPQPITAHVHVCQLLNHKMVQPLECSGKKVFRDNLVLQSLCVSFDIGLQFKPDGLYVKMYNGMVFIMAKPLY
ncbi:uncharacterized protein [Dermacentor albipictus]|uniref:uncharacterized protein isoform X7 n=1 Tax=Dermacentor albipictus TaxID=60249 RepID=UPI0038FC47DC